MKLSLNSPSEQSSNQPIASQPDVSGISHPEHKLNLHFTLIDYTTISSYIRCPRYFLFTHILGLRSIGPNIHLDFGSCWHSALEIGYTEVKKDPSVLRTDPQYITKLSQDSFQSIWNREYVNNYPNPDLIFPKTPARACDMLAAYWPRFAFQDSELDIIGIEKPFRIHMENYPDYIGIIDLSFRKGDSFGVLEHKTGKYFNDTMMVGYETSMQVEGYMTALSLYTDHPRVIINHALTQKTKIDFNRQSISKPSKMLDRFIAEYKHYVSQLLNDCYSIEQYLSVNIDELLRNKNLVLTLFPRRTEQACTAYFRPCPFYIPCSARNNPLTYAHDTLMDYQRTWWDPIKHAEEKSAMAKLNTPDVIEVRK